MKKKIIIIAVIVFLLLALGVGGYFIFGNKDKKDDKTKSNTKSKTTITITFDADGGTEVEPMKVKKGEKFELPKTEKKGYFFQGWFDGDVYYSDEDTDKLEKDTTLKALWANPDTPEDDVELKVVFDSKGGSKVKDMTFKCSDGVAVLKNLPKSKKDSYEFLSWEDKHGKSILDGAKIMCDESSLKLYAVWEYDGPVANPEQDPNASKNYKCNEGQLVGDKCIITKEAKTKCPGQTYEFNGKCITLTSQAQNDDQINRVCGKTTVVVDNNGHTQEVQGDVKYAGYYYCAYGQVKQTQYECTTHGYKWIDGKCYRTSTGPGVNITYSCKVPTNYVYLTTSQSNSLRQNSNLSGCFPYTSKVPYCESDYTLKDSKCVKTIDATLK